MVLGFDAGCMTSAPAGAASLRYAEISGKDLLKVARAVISREDVANVTGRAWRDGVRSGGAVDAEFTTDGRERAVIEAIDLGGVVALRRTESPASPATLPS